MGIRKKAWGVHQGQNVYLITLDNGALEVSLTNLGCTIISIVVPDKNGHKKNVVLGYDSLQGYLNDPYYMGCIVGRFANRISKARFSIAGVEYRLAANEAGKGTHLHGGNEGFNKKVFHLTDSVQEAENCVHFFYTSPDGEEGYPGNLDVHVTYQLTAQNEVVIKYKATTDKTTPVNLTNHSYFNLSGKNSQATRHELFINADRVMVGDQNYIPTGELKPVAGTELDFTTWRRIDTEASNAAFKGYNDYFSNAHGTPVHAGLRDPASGRSMLVRSTYPGIMLYTGDFLNTPFIKNGGICLETQFFPDSPNRPEFPQALLSPGDVFQHETVYQFIY